MRRAAILGWVVAAGVCGSAAARSLPLAERIDCQRRIEGVYAALRGGTAGDEQLAAAARTRAEDTVRLSAALEAIWGRPILAEQLQAEIDRAVRASQRPTVLRQIFAAVDDDPYLVAECVARPALARRLARNWYAWDERFHAGVRAAAEREAERWRADGLVPVAAVALDVEPREIAPHLARAFGRATDVPIESLPVGVVSPLVEDAQRFSAFLLERDEHGGLQARSAHWDKRAFDVWWGEIAASHATDRALATDFAFALPATSEPAAAACTADTWEPTASDVPDPRDRPAAVWTGAEMIVFGGDSFPAIVGDGARYDPATDTWSPTSRIGAPSDRYLHTMVWTESRAIVWGGITEDGTTNTGASYDPATDTWSPVSAGTGVPAARASHSAVWTGSRMIVWGGASFPQAFADGALYDPSSDTWVPLAATTLAARYDHTAVWTGSVMVVWGGQNYPARFNDGARYNPVSNSWSGVNPSGAPAARVSHTAVWTGSRMVVWGGQGTSVTFLQTGGRYNPTTDTWQNVTPSGAPSGRYDHSAVWTGSEMIVWGGLVGIGLRGNTGGRYNPVTDAWSAVSTGPGVPQRRMRHAAVWAGSEMIVWGGDDYGFDGFLYLQSGGRYAPATNSWVPTAAGASVPEARRYSSVAWTGAEMIVWGGFGSQLLATGGRYDPALDDWSPTATVDAPPGRILHSAVWTGERMIVWGGQTPFDAVATGGLYDPLLDDWSQTATAGAPAPRALHSAVWSGREMVIAGVLDTVGRYDPSTNSWKVSAAPPIIGADRNGHVAGWTGTELLLWGGRSSEEGEHVAEGGRYDARWDSWLRLRAPDGPPPAEDATAAWTESEWIVWGGAGPTGFSEAGARFDPANGTWAPISDGPDDPSPRRFATAVWTGDEVAVWGGITPSPSLPLRDGARYDPAADAWTTVTELSAPSERQRHGAIFSDGPDPRMIVWGGLPNASSGGVWCAPCTPRTWYRDADGDNHGDPALTTIACTRPTGFAPDPGDCDDLDFDRYPGNTEFCDLEDNDCNDVVDDAVAPGRVSELYIVPTGISGIVLEWPHVAGADHYDLARGSVVELVQSGGDFALAADACLANDVITRKVTDLTAPPAGDAFWYVARPANCAGNGSYDEGVPSQVGTRQPAVCP